VAQALEQGHLVTVFVRKPAAISRKYDHLKVVQGDVLDYPSVETAVQGQDAVLSALGVRKLRKNTILSDGTNNIIQAMERHGVKRSAMQWTISAQAVGTSLTYSFIE
jgi:putative NADH-flavin reductase